VIGAADVLVVRLLNEALGSGGISQP